MVIRVESKYSRGGKGESKIKHEKQLTNYENLPYFVFVKKWVRVDVCRISKLGNNDCKGYGAAENADLNG